MDEVWTGASCCSAAPGWRSAGLRGAATRGSGSKEETEKVVKAKVDGDLVYFNWSEYLDPELIKKFEKRYGVKVRQSNFDSMAAMLAKLRSGNRYDIIFPDQSVTPRLVAGNQLLKIDHDQLKNFDQVFEFFHDPVYDPGAAHTRALRDVRHRGHLARGQDQRHDRVLGRPLPARTPRARSTCSTTSRRPSGWRTTRTASS